jgi:hypothetical protein
VSADPFAESLITGSAPLPGIDAPIIESDDPQCVVCGIPLSYGGRGRKPKYCDEHKKQPANSTPGRSRATGDVEAALAAMDTLYAGVTMVMMMLNTEAAQTFAAGIDAAQVQNRMAFTNDVKLTKSITRGAAKGGKGVFVATQVMLVAPAARVIYDSQRSAAKRAPAMPSRPRAVPDPPTAPTGTAPSFADPVDANIARNRH